MHLLESEFNSRSEDFSAKLHGVDRVELEQSIQASIHIHLVMPSAQAELACSNPGSSAGQQRLIAFK